MKERMMKTEALNFLRAFYLGMAAGSVIDGAIDIEQEHLPLFGDMAEIARAIGSEGNSLTIAVANKANVTLHGSEEVHEDVLAALMKDFILNGVSKLASSVTMHTDASLDSAVMRDLHKMLGKYLEIP